MEQKEYEKTINEKDQEILELKRENQALRMLYKQNLTFSNELTKVIHRMDQLLEKKKPIDFEITLGEERVEEDLNGENDEDGECENNENGESYVEKKWTNYIEFEEVEENDFIKTKEYYLCPEKTCTFKSLRLSKMNEHFRIHTGNKPFACKICEYRSGNITTMKTHVQIHFSIKQRKVCSVCQKNFSNNSNLKRHQKKCKKNI